MIYYKYIYNKMLPFRNRLDYNKDFKLDYNKKYKINESGKNKPNGFWYQIKDSIEPDLWGPYVYTVKLKPDSFIKINDKPKKNKILLITTFNDYIKLFNKYGYIRHYTVEELETPDPNFKSNLTDEEKEKDPWEGKERFYYEVPFDKIKKHYGGIEIRNVEKIKKIIFTEKYVIIHDLLENWDFSSGCIWNLKLIKEVKYFKKI
jgi:hypothetical protein